jgi:hypothetical protein
MESAVYSHFASMGDARIPEQAMAIVKSKVIESRAHLNQLKRCDEKLPEELRSTALEPSLNAAERLIQELAAAEAKYRELSDQTQVELKKFNALMVRARSAVKGIYGPDSDEYQAIGGKKASERAKPGRKPKSE